jgi:hypothetical protein
MSKASVLVKGRSSFSCTAALLGKARGTLQQVWSYRHEQDPAMVDPSAALRHDLPPVSDAAVPPCRFEDVVDLDMACAA